MTALADLTPAELRDRKRALAARIVRRNKAIIRARGDIMEADLQLAAVRREIAQREQRAKGNSVKR